MGDIVPFIARVRDTGDWSPGERARLEEFADRLSASGARIEIIFGTTDEGDPWCVVKDENEDVLVHVARIGGRFVVYSAIEDVVAEDSNLYEALRDRLADAVEIPTAKVLQFGLGREAQTFIALIVATAFFYETTGLDVGLDPQAAPMELQPQAEPVAPVANAEEAETGRDVAIQGAVFAETFDPDLMNRQLVAMTTADESGDELPPPVSSEDQPQVLPIETATRQVASAMLARSEATQTAASERLSGGQAGERIMGGAGADTLRGSALDTIQGGAGDDRLIIAGATAIGGEGADTFVIVAPAAMGHADTLLGVIEDFSADEGDKITTEGGVNVSLTPPTLAPGADRQADKSTTTTTTTTTTQPADVWTRVEIDVNGDGVIDGYVLVRPRPPGASPVEDGGEKGDLGDPGVDDLAWEIGAVVIGQNLVGAADPWVA